MAIRRLEISGVSVEKERETIVINIRMGNTTRFIDLTEEQAKELFFQLSQIDFSDK